MEHKAHISKMLLSYTINQETSNKYTMDSSSVEELKTMYNYITGIYRGLGMSQQSRSSMKSIFYDTRDLH